MRISDWSSDVCSSDLQELTAAPHQLVDRLDHVNRDADRARLIGDRAGDRLANPPGRIGAELVAAAIFELVDRLHQADVAFLDQVEELQPAVGVFLGDRDDEAQIRLDHFLLRSEEHTSELQSLMRISYAVFCLKKKK